MGLPTFQARPPKTVLRGLSRAVGPVRAGSTQSEPSVLVDQRLRKAGLGLLSYLSLCSCEEVDGVLGNENGEIGVRGSDKEEDE